MRPHLKSLLILLATMPAPAWAFGLLDGFRLAQRNDPLYQAARAERDAGQANYTIGRSQLLPMVSANTSRSKVNGEREIGGTTSDLDYQSRSTVLQLRQPLFNMERMAEYRQGKARAEYSQSVFDKKEKDLAVRYVTAYLEVLLAEHTIALIDAKLGALKETHIQAKRQYERGDGTVIDMREAEARMAIAEAQRFETRDQYAMAERTLASITGETPQWLSEPGKGIGTFLETTGSLPDWLAEANRNSPDIAAAQKKVDIAMQELKKARAGHYPTVDFIASHNRNRSDTVTTINQKNTLNTLGLQLSFPIFSGGYVNATVEQAASSLAQATAEFDHTRRQTELEVSRQFYGINNGASKVAAQQQAVIASQDALKATQMGVISGIRTATDVLNAEEQLYQARHDLAQAGYEQLVSWVGLRASTGLLSEADIILLDQAFVVRNCPPSKCMLRR